MLLLKVYRVKDLNKLNPLKEEEGIIKVKEPNNYFNKILKKINIIVVMVIVIPTVSFYFYFYFVLYFYYLFIYLLINND